MSTSPSRVDDGGSARRSAELRPQTPVDVYDATLRDGTQRVGISLTCEDKLRIAARLDDAGVAFIEGGYPGSNPKDIDFFRRARDRAWKSATLVAFGSTRRAKLAVEDDPQFKALLAAATPACAIFGKSSRLHVTEVLRVSLDENLRMIEESVAYLRTHDRRVIYDAEHFFDGYRDDPAYALESLQAAARGGAEVLVLCDTNGGSLPWQVEEALAGVQRTVAVPNLGDARERPPTIGIHAHDDVGCAVANTLAAVRAGVRHVQGTINGYGERCGNVNLCTIVANLELKMGFRALRREGLRELHDLSHFVAEVANVTPDEHLPYVGDSAFAHKGGTHVAAMRRTPLSYNHVDPALVGNRTRVVMSELSGRANVQSLAEEHGVGLEEGADLEVLGAIKESEARGCAFDAAEASIELMMRRRAPGYQAPFRLLDYTVMVGNRAKQEFAEASIKIAVGAETMHTAAEGNGPVGALALALRKALVTAFPAILAIQLVDYKVRILDGSNGTSAVTRVLIDSRAGARQWSTVGASANIIEASWQALADSIEYGLTLPLETEA
jgi:2-isopropylmalate synthase